MAAARQCSWPPPPPGAVVAAQTPRRRFASQQQQHHHPHRCCAAVDQTHTPLLDAVLERGERCGEVPFHVPGHKRGSSSGAPPGLRRLLGGGLRYDLTELQGG